MTFRKLFVNDKYNNMKIFKIFLVAIVSLFFVPATTHAQFLKKVAKTAKQVAKSTFSDDESPEKTSSDPAGTNQSEGSKSVLKKTDAQNIDFEKHQISVSVSATASFLAGEFFMENYSSIQAKDHKIIATVVVGVMTEEERLSESGDASEKDVAIIYENGRRKNETTIGNLDKDLLFLNKKYDWYPIKEVANGTESHQYIKPAKNGMSYNISINGKTYGPYLMVGKMIIDYTKTRFYATVSVTQKDLEDQKIYLLSNSGKLKPIDFGGELLANIDFTNGCTIISPVTLLVSKIAKEENEAKQKALQDQMADVMMNHPNENSVIFFDGKKLPNILTATPWLDHSGNNLFSIKVDQGNGLEAGLYLNGKKIEENEPGQGQGWCNADASNWAYAVHDYKEGALHLIFKDGTDVPGVIHPRQIVADGKNYIVWFMYDRTKSDEINMCSKEL
jgi:hypothetical protein